MARTSSMVQVRPLGRLTMDDKVVVKNDPPDEVPTEVLAKAITEIADAATKLLNGRLSHRAIVILIHDATGVKRSDISKVLAAASNLKRRYVR